MVENPPLWWIRCGQAVENPVITLQERSERIREKAKNHLLLFLRGSVSRHADAQQIASGERLTGLWHLDVGSPGELERVLSGAPSPAHHLVDLRLPCVPDPMCKRLVQCFSATGLQARRETSGKLFASRGERSVSFTSSIPLTCSTNPSNAPS